MERVRRGFWDFIHRAKMELSENRGRGRRVVGSGQLDGAVSELDMGMDLGRSK